MHQLCASESTFTSGGSGHEPRSSTSQFGAAPNPAKSAAVADLTSALEARGFGGLGGFGGAGPIGRASADRPQTDEPAPAAAPRRAPGQPVAPLAATQPDAIGDLWSASAEPWMRQ